MKLTKLISVNILAIAVAGALFIGLPTGALAMTPTLAVATDNDEGDNDEGNHNVPDAGSTALLLGSALGGLAVIRRFVKR